MGYYIPRKKLFTGANFKEIPDVFALERVGAGHDGFVYRDGDIAYNEKNGKYYLYFKHDEDQTIAYVKSRILKPISFRISSSFCSFKYILFL